MAWASKLGSHLDSQKRDDFVVALFLCQKLELTIILVFVTNKIYIRATGSYAPTRVLTNDDMAQFVDTSDEWIYKRTGIRSRHLIEKEGAMSTVDMAELASYKALKMANLTALDIDLIICGTVTPDYRLPSAACILQHKLQAKNAFAFDVSAACAASLYGLNIADRFIASGQCTRALVIGAETLSTIVNWSDRNTSVLFGDAGSAAIVEMSSSQGNGFIDFILRSDGDYWQSIWIPEGGSKTPLTTGSLEQKADRVLMNGRETYRFAVKALSEVAQEILARNKMQSADISHVVAHQANLRIIEAVAERLDVPLERFVLNIERYANTSSASLLTTFDEGLRSGRFQKGDLILMLAIGAGFAWGASIYRV